MKYPEAPFPTPEEIAFNQEVFHPNPNDTEQSFVLEKSVIEKIERIRNQKIKLEIALLVTGEKPACILNFDGSIREIIDLLHLPNVLDMENGQILVGKDIESFEALQAAREIKEDPEYTLALGSALGYPATAVEAFVNKELIDNDDLPDDVKNQRILNLIDFKLSKSHWQEELDTIRKQAESIKDLVPDIYEQINNDKQKETI